MRRFREIALKHIQGNMIIYFIVMMFFIIGISAGAFTVKSLSDSHKQELISYMRGFFSILIDRPINGFSVLKQSLANNLQTGALIWLLGVTVIGIPFILLLIAARGFIVGFTVGFLADQLGLKGALFSIITILPQNIIIIPGIIVVAVIGIGFSTMIIKNKVRKSYNSHNDSTLKQFILYSTIVLFLCGIISIGCLVEAYVTPVFMRLLSSYM